LWSKHNPFYTGPDSNWLALIPFVVLVLLLYLTGREIILARRRAAPVTE